MLERVKQHIRSPFFERLFCRISIFPLNFVLRVTSKWGGCYMLEERYGERIRCFTPAPMLDTFTLRYEHVNEQSVNYTKKNFIKFCSVKFGPDRESLSETNTLAYCLDHQ